MQSMSQVFYASDIPDPATPPAPTYTSGAAAKICGVSQQTVIRCFDGGLIGGFRVPDSKFRRITREGLFRFMLSNGIPMDRLGELRPEERAAVTAKVVGPVRLTLPNRLKGVALAPLTATG